MKKFSTNTAIISVIAGITFIVGSCTEDLLDRPPTTEVFADEFWKTEDDATTALLGAYSSVRQLFDRDYYFEGLGEYTRCSGTSSSTVHNSSGYNNPSNYGHQFDKMYQYLYGGVHRTNYVIENVTKMLSEANPTSVASLEAIIGEARLLRGMVYFRLISMWGDVPYISKIVYSDAEVSSISRTPIGQIKDSIMADFTYAIEKLPDQAAAFGRTGKPAALAFRGKLQLYWACWNKFGWPKLDGFVPSATEANNAYAAAAADFKRVIEDFGLNLFRGGEPGECDVLGKAEKLPNYFYLFIPTTGNGAEEVLMSFTHGGTGSNQSESLVRDFGGRTVENSQLFLNPRFELADRYQSTITGDFCDPLIPTAPSVSGARTKLNSAINPQSYANRDYRMKSSILWDYEMIMGILNLQETGWSPFIYKTWNATVTIDGVKYKSYNCDRATHGYVFRKFLRNYAGQDRVSGDFAWPVMRLPDVYLMYAEATNELNGPQADAIELVNKVRHRGNLPGLLPHMIADKQAFFNAIEQERIVELLAEGHRSFDLRRWRALERVWGPPYGDGKWRMDTHGANVNRYFQNESELVYQKCYIFRIPPSERERNPNLTQNTPWL